MNRASSHLSHERSELNSLYLFDGQGLYLAPRTTPPNTDSHSEKNKMGLGKGCRTACRRGPVLPPQRLPTEQGDQDCLKSYIESKVIGWKFRRRSLSYLSEVQDAKAALAFGKT